MQHVSRFFSIFRKPAHIVGIAIFMLIIASSAIAQTGGDGAIEGTVLDANGAVVPNATVTAVNVNTGLVTTRPTTSAGFYSITSLVPGTYTVTVTAKSFETYKQENLIIDAMHVSGLNVHLSTGTQSETVTVTQAPPALETTNATLGGTIENSVYTALPLMLSTVGAGNQQRDITQFSNLLPGAQVAPGGRSSVIGGSEQRMGELYVDGLPTTTAGIQADNRPVYNILPLESIEQVTVLTSGFSAEYSGSGLENYTTKSGTNQYHATAFGYFRNRIFDAWSFTTHPCPVGCANTSTNNPTTGFSNKPLEHVYEIGLTGGGPVRIPHLFDGRDKLFFYGTYDKYRQRLGANFASATVPTTLEKTGNFQELLSVVNGGLGNTSGSNFKIYDPTTQAACTAHTGTACRYQYGFGPGAGTSIVATGAAINVIPASEQSPITQAMQNALGTPTNNTQGVISGNYLGGNATGYNNWLYSTRLDYQATDKNRISFLFASGRRVTAPYTGNGTLPFPYLNTSISIIGGHITTLEDSYVITPHLVNQFKYGFINFNAGAVQNPSAGSAYGTANFGVTGLPAGQTSIDFPNTTFTGNAAPTGWGGNNPTSSTLDNTFEIVDNVQYVRGAHAMNFGLQFQWLQINASFAGFDTGSSQLGLTWNANDTANLKTPTTYDTTGGAAYASFLLGAVNTATTTLSPAASFGVRYKTLSPYFQDDWKVTPKLTLNLGLRWDYLPAYTEVEDRTSFLNPNIANPITGNLGSLQFAGNHGGPGVSCNCHNLINTWYKNFGPRLGLAYSLNNKTVIRASYAIIYGRAGGVGGTNANDGTGVTGFSFPTSITETQTAPAFYLNNNPTFSSVSPTSGGGGVPTPNANFGGPGYVVAPPVPVTALNQQVGTGYYVCGGQTAPYSPCAGATGTYSGNGSGIGYADPYLGDRAPEIIFWNLGFQRELTKNSTIMVNYVGTQSHFLAGNANLRGLQSGQINPSYLASVGNANLNLPATTTNVNNVQTSTGVTLPVPYAGYETAAGLSTSPTIAHMLTWMPQYGGTTDSFGDVANANFNALELTLNQRVSHGLTYTVNYTYSKSIDDDGTIRSGYAIPAAVTANGKAWSPDRIDRARSTNDLPQNLTIFGVYSLPFGKNGYGGDHFAVRAVASGWQVSAIYQYASGLPLAIVGTATSPAQNIGQGTYMPDYNPNFAGSPRINGKWGQGVTTANISTVTYLQGYISTTGVGLGTNNNTNAGGTAACAASVGPFCNTAANTIGDLSRTAPYDLRGPNVYRLTMALSRTFDITERVKFVFRVDCQNVTNHVTFGNNAQNNTIGVNVNAAAFGTLGGATADPRAFQLAGRLSF